MVDRIDADSDRGHPGGIGDSGIAGGRCCRDSGIYQYYCRSIFRIRVLRRSDGTPDFGGYGCLRLRDDLVCPSDKNLERLSLDTRLEGTVEGDGDSVKAGDCGETLGRLAPMGNVKLGDMVVEAESRSGYIDAHRPVEVVKVLKNKVIVQLKTV